ncbi:aspartate kinase [Pseudohaliea rubra]
MLDYRAVRDNIFLHGGHSDNLYGRVFVVSAYAGITNRLLEHKKSGRPGIYALFSGSEQDASWQEEFTTLREEMHALNSALFDDEGETKRANAFIDERLYSAEACLNNLAKLCGHGHFSLEAHLDTVREMLASLGEAHSAWNTAQLLQRDGVNACFVDLTAWRSEEHLPLDDRIQEAMAEIDVSTTMPIVTGYAHSDDGLMANFDRGYSEMTFSRLAVITGASEAVVHKEFHLSSADPKVVGEDKVVPIGRTNYDVADQLANLGMEAIHPKAAKGLRQSGIPLRVKNTFEPEHTGTLITSEYISSKPCVEIIAGCRGVYALEVFDQEMAGQTGRHDQEILGIIRRYKAHIVSKDMNANTITHYLACNLKTVKRIRREIEAQFPSAELDQQRVAVVSAIGSDMQIPGILARTVTALAEDNVSVLAMHQSRRQVDMQFMVSDSDYERAVVALHRKLVEPIDHGRAISLAS